MEYVKEYACPDTADRSDLLETIEKSPINKEALRKIHHGKECIICFEKECVCNPK